MIVLEILLGLAAVVIGYLLVRLYLMRKSADEIAEAFREKLQTETNTLIDISSRDKHMRRLAGEINDSLRALRAQRLRLKQGGQELSDAVVNLSHDLRTPLTAICGYLDLLGREEKSEADRKYIGMIENRVEALKALTAEMFSYALLSASEPGACEPVSINRLLEDSLTAFYAAFAGRGIEPEISLPSGAVVRSLNPSHLMRVYENIISNALKYSDGDMAVTMDEAGHITFSNTARALDALLTARLFDRYFTVETGERATGLGLSIARLLVEQMGGTVDALWREGVLEVHLDFPL